MPDALLYGDSIRSPELRHEVPLAIGDPFVYLERNGRRVAVLTGMEISRAREAAGDGLEIIPFDSFGWDEIVRGATSTDDALCELVARVCEQLEVREARVPGSFPLAVAELLRERGVTLQVDGAEFVNRRRIKNVAELAGIRRAQRATDAAIAAVAAMLREAGGDKGGLVLGGEPLTCERLRRRAEEVLAEHDASGEELIIVAHGAQSADGHDPGSGQVLAGEAIVVDVFPRDRVSGCYADTTRTFCVGEPPAELVEYHRLCLDALQRAVSAVRPGVSGRDLFRIACAVFEEAGYPTQQTKKPGEMLLDGFYHSLGHGVGLEVHESPSLGRAGQELVAGDVVAIEPGCYRQGFGGCRIEDLVLVTADGAETLTQLPYGLVP
ncbi:MAG: Xaa-Pro aminopeptidase [Gaiellaceae bacterium]|nr:Xaa-Pro aminopeptidase [Gaiellaceae bacterium]